jgi:hypothetical protein
MIAKECGMTAHENARFALEYVELYATSLGLGTCWAGFVELAAGSNYQPLLATMAYMLLQGDKGREPWFLHKYAETVMLIIKAKHSTLKINKR